MKTAVEQARTLWYLPQSLREGIALKGRAMGNSSFPPGRCFKILLIQIEQDKGKALDQREPDARVSDIIENIGDQ